MAQLCDEEIVTLRQIVEDEEYGNPFTLKGIGRYVDDPTAFGARVKETCEDAPEKVPFVKVYDYYDYPHDGRVPVKSADNLILYVRR